MEAKLADVEMAKFNNPRRLKLQRKMFLILSAREKQAVEAVTSHNQKHCRASYGVDKVPFVV